jgi:hypothetical protein
MFAPAFMDQLAGKVRKARAAQSGFFRIKVLYLGI